ncbi:hypothetical protein ACWDG9_17380 [Streptomyces sp. NPDC001073]
MTGKPAEPLMAAAEEAHSGFGTVEAAYEAAARHRQSSFARAIDAHGRGGQVALARRIGLTEPTVRNVAERGRAQRVDLFEDSGGVVSLRRGNDNAVWSFGAAPDEGEFAKDAAAWQAGDWQPGEAHGQRPVPAARLPDLTHIATWWPDGIVDVLTNEMATPVAGANGRTYLGIPLDSGRQ